MTSDVEAMGALATAGLAANAIDPVRPQHGGHRGVCANCEAALIGDFCHACGQSAHLHRSIGHVIEEFLHGIWHFDSKSWRTLPLLAFRPGRLTHDYIYGKRARYVAPLALFLLSVFLMFFVFGFVGSPNLGSNPVTMASVRTQVADAERAVRDETAALATITDPDERRKAAAELATDSKEVAEARAALQTVEAEPAVERAANPTTGGWKADLAKEARSGRLKINTGMPAVNENIRKALENPDFAIYRVQQKAYKLSFLLVPLSLPLLWMMFLWRRDVTVYDHTVFALYSLSFMSLLFVVLVLLGKVADAAALPALTTVAGFLALTPPIHMYAQLKGTYRLSRLGALIRTVLLTIGSVATLMLFFAIIVVLGLAD